MSEGNRMFAEHLNVYRMRRCDSDSLKLFGVLELLEKEILRCGALGHRTHLSKTSHTS